MHRDRHGNWLEAVAGVFGEPARAIWRNVIVIAVGFLPLLFAPLVPYKTVGVLMATILVVAGLATLLILPALTRLLENLLFPETRICCFACKCGTCVFASVAAVALVLTSVHRFLEFGLTGTTLLGAAAVLVLAGVCRWSSKREKCRKETGQ
jgi:hypothetical protein